MKQKTVDRVIKNRKISQIKSGFLMNLHRKREWQRKATTDLSMNTYHLTESTDLAK
jgi:hypothetical protein